ALSRRFHPCTGCLRNQQFVPPCLTGHTVYPAPRQSSSSYCPGIWRPPLHRRSVLLRLEVHLQGKPACSSSAHEPFPRNSFPPSISFCAALIPVRRPDSVSAQTTFLPPSQSICIPS
ncbi:hypothetical protein PPTG_24978, partial [Phytophthora nicotianae INRA-310]